MTGTRVNQDIFVANAIGLLSQATGVGGLVNTFQRLQYDTSLYGLGSLNPVVTPIATASGTVYRSFSPSGQMMTYTPVAVAAAASVVNTLLGGSSSFPAAIPGLPFFNTGGANMMNMFGRLPPTAGAGAKTMLTVMQANMALQTISRAAQIANRGGNPLQALFPGL